MSWIALVSDVCTTMLGVTLGLLLFSLQGWIWDQIRDARRHKRMRKQARP